MAASHDGLLRVSLSPGQLQMTCTSEFVALPLTKTILGVWWLGDLSRKVKVLNARLLRIVKAYFNQRKARGGGGTPKKIG